MSVLQIIFLVTGFVTLLAGVMVVASPKLVHAALWLIVSLAGVAVLFVLLNANFLAVVQVVVYIGAIAILIIFTVMLTRRVMADSGPTHNRTWWVALLSAVVLLGGLLALIWQHPAFQAVPAELAAADTSLTVLGTSLVDVNRYLVPFEVASVLLLAALIGAIAVARPVAKGEEADE
ncbi:MAG: NADH-quinone oxidoreductase subunit J [Chloroflexi bacterium]|nr:NADH-quinone oxidoreductase subunit J [Chloroflexota bacterium]